MTQDAKYTVEDTDRFVERNEKTKGSSEEVKK